LLKKESAVEAAAGGLAPIVGGIAPRGTNGAGRRKAGKPPGKAMQRRFKRLFYLSSHFFHLFYQLLRLRSGLCYIYSFKLFELCEKVL
jgi:hypothetical protein